MISLDDTNLEIRIAAKNDLEKLRDLALKAWQYTYKDIYSSDYIQKQIDAFYTIKFHKIILEKCKSGRHIFLVLILKSEIIGMIDFDFNDEYCQLTRLYLDPNYIGIGYGKMLLQSGEDFLKGANIESYIVYVHKQNLIGSGFYLKNGFVRCPEKDDDEDFCLIKKITY